MTITLTPEVEAAVAEQARQRGITPKQLAADSLRYLFATPEPSEEEEEWYRVQVQLTLAQIDRLTEETAQEDPEVEARRRESERAERAALAEDTRRMLDGISKIDWSRNSRSARGGEAVNDDEAREQELKALRLEHQRLCAEAGRDPGWLFGKVGVG